MAATPSDSDENDGSSLGTVVKAGAAAAVVGTAKAGGGLLRRLARR